MRVRGWEGARHDFLWDESGEMECRQRRKERVTSRTEPVTSRKERVTSRKERVTSRGRSE
jgi:hypothetical protein